MDPLKVQKKSLLSNITFDWAFSVWASNCTFSGDLCHFPPILAQLPPPATQACVPYPSIYIFQIKVAFKRSDIALFTSVVFRLMPCHWLSVSLFTLFESGCCVNAAFVACLLVFGRREPHHSEQASDFEDGDTSQDRGYLCLQELEERVCHHGEAKPLQHCLLTQGRLCLDFYPGGNLCDMIGSQGASSCRRRSPGSSSDRSWQGWATSTARASYTATSSLKTSCCRGDFQFFLVSYS